MRVFIFEQDEALRDLLTRFARSKGHEVHSFADQYSCRAYAEDSCNCPADSRCADAVIINTRVPTLDNIRILLDQVKKGCRLPSPNKAVMSALMTDAHEQAIHGQGFSAIRKPFRLARVNEWLAACERRLAAEN